MVKNNAKTTMAARLTDQLPGDMSLLGASLAPESYDANYIHWVLPELKPNEILTIEYDVHAARKVAYVLFCKMIISPVPNISLERRRIQSHGDI